MGWYPKAAKNEHKHGNKKVPNFGTFLVGAPGRIRTCDLPVRSRALYPLSYKRMHTFNVLDYFSPSVLNCQVPF